jgi:hypothetical protein
MIGLHVSPFLSRFQPSGVDPHPANLSGGEQAMFIQLLTSGQGLLWQFAMALALTLFGRRSTTEGMRQASQSPEQVVD